MSTAPAPRPPLPWDGPAYDLGPPKTHPIGDHAVDLRGDALLGRRVALLVCGGIAAFKAPALLRALRREGAETTVFLSEEASRYVAPDALSWAADRPVVTALSPRAEHLSDAAPVDAYLLAPATYNSINKLAAGVADSLITTTLASALGRMERGQAAVLVAPTMHGSMHNSILQGSLHRLRGLGVHVIPPRDALGKDNLPTEDALVAAVCRALAPPAAAALRIALIGGRWPRPDGSLPGAPLPQGPEGDWRATAWRLHLRGHQVGVLVSAGAGGPADGLPTRRFSAWDEARAFAQGALNDGAIDQLRDLSLR